MSQQSVTKGEVGVRTVCGATFKLLASSGVIRKHGHGHDRPYCAGSDLLPRPSQAHTLDPSSDLVAARAVDSPSESDNKTSSEFILPTPARTTIRRIPRGARVKAAQGLEARIRIVILPPDDPENWSNLFRFGDCLSQLVRGRKRFNLTS